MKSNLLLYLTAGFNAGALSSLLLQRKNSEFFPSGKEIATMALSGLAAISSVGYLLSKKGNGDQNAFIDTKEDTARKMETMLV